MHHITYAYVVILHITKEEKLIEVDKIVLQRFRRGVGMSVVATKCIGQHVDCLPTSPTQSH